MWTQSIAKLKKKDMFTVILIDVWVIFLHS